MQKVRYISGIFIKRTSVSKLTKADFHVHLTGECTKENDGQVLRHQVPNDDLSKLLEVKNIFTLHMCTQREDWEIFLRITV